MFQPILFFKGNKTYNYYIKINLEKNKNFEKNKNYKKIIKIFEIIIKMLEKK